MPSRIAGIALHQYVNGNLIPVMQTEAKITVRIKMKRSRLESQRPTSGNKKEGPNAGK